MPTVVLAASLLLVAATATTVARRVSPLPLSGVLLAVYLLAFAEVVGLTLVLSTVRALERWTLAGGTAVLFAAAVAAGRRWPARAPARPRAALRELRATFRDPLVAVLGAVVAAALVYVAALGTFTPPNDWDAMTYHLARAAFWIQQGGVGYVPGSQILRIDVNPPNAEIASAYTMALSGSDRFVWIAEYAALLALAAAIYGVSRQLGFDRQAAAVGALLFLSLPPVALQGASALNDLVVASFLLAATYFLLGHTRTDVALGGLAVALAVGTKFTALIALPLLAAVVLARQPRRRWPRVFGAGLAGVTAGSYWLVVNLVETGSLDGGAGSELEQHPDRSPAAVLARTTRLLVNFADDLNLERDRLLYPLAAALFAVAALVLDRRLARRWIGIVSAVAVGTAALAMPWIREALLRAHEKAWLVLGRADLAFLDRDRETWSPSTVFSSFGPLGLLALVAAIVLVVAQARRDRLGHTALLLAAAPLVFAPILALALVYDPWRARFFIFAMGLSAATWGVVLRRRALAWGLASVAAVTLLIAFVHSIEKPAGIRLLQPRTSGVWGKPRDVVQTWLREDGTREVVRFFAHEPESGRVGVVAAEDDWVYPYFGRTLGRDVVFASGSVPRALDWLVARPAARLDPGIGWEPVLETEDGWRVYERAPSASP